MFKAFGNEKGVNTNGSFFTRQPPDVIQPAWAKAIEAKDMKKLQKNVKDKEGANAVWNAQMRLSYTNASKKSGVAVPPEITKNFKFFDSAVLPWTPILWAAGCGWVEGVQWIENNGGDLSKILTRFNKTGPVREFLVEEFPHMVQHLKPVVLPVPVTIVPAQQQLVQPQPIMMQPPQPVMMQPPQPVMMQPPQPQPVLMPPPQPQAVFALMRERYDAASASELTVYANDTVEVLRADASGWSQCRRRDGAMGWVPSSFLESLQQQVSPMSPPPPLSSSQNSLADVEERIRRGVEQMLMEHKMSLTDLLKRDLSASVPTPDTLELRLRVLEMQAVDWDFAIEHKLSMQLEDQRRAAQEDRNQIWMKIRKLESDGDTGSATLVGLRADLQRVEAVQAELVVMSKAAFQREEARKKYGSEPRVWDFYNNLCIHFEQFLLGTKAAASGVVAHDMQSAVGKAGSFVCILGEVCEMIPVVGSFAKLISGAGAAVAAVDHKRQQVILQRISKLATMSEMQNLACNLAYALTRRYEYQLMQMPLLQETKNLPQPRPKWSVRAALKSVQQKVEKVLFDEDPKSASEALSDYVLAMAVLVISELRETLDPTELEARIFQCVTQPLSELSFLSEKATGGLQKLLRDASKFEIALDRNRSGGKVWTFEGIFTKPGLRTHNGCFFAGAGNFMDPFYYQYCIADDAEVMRRQLVYCDVLPVGAAPTAAHGSQGKFVKAVVNSQQNVDANVELLKRQLQAQQAQLHAVSQQLSANNVRSSPVVDNVRKAAEEVFDLYDTTRSGGLTWPEFHNAWSELVVLDKEHFGPRVADDVLMATHQVLCRQQPQVLKEAFVEFYRKAYSFKLEKTCQLTLQKGH